MRATSRNLRKDPRSRCICGLRVSLHFMLDNRKMDCDEVRYVHPRASVRHTDFSELMFDTLEEKRGER